MHKLVPPICSCDVALESTEFATEVLFSGVNKHVYSQSRSLLARIITLVAFVGFLFWVNTPVSFQVALRGAGIVALVALKRFVSVVYGHNVLFKIWNGSTGVFAKLTFVRIFFAMRKHVSLQVSTINIWLIANVTAESFFSTLESMVGLMFFQITMVVGRIITLIALKKLFVCVPVEDLSV